MPPSWATDTVVLVYRAVSGQDVYGNDIYAETLTPVSGCRVQPVSSTEDTNLRDQIVTQWLVFAPYTIDVTGVDEVEYGGRRYEIHGDPKPWRSATGRLAHTEITLREVTG